MQGSIIAEFGLIMITIGGKNLGWVEVTEMVGNVNGGLSAN